ncbi:MAG: hypothetical protein CMJ32_07095 [Phycisphaerae bacterium]|nr:hypothetical protein [Phycisphaerae bacterium]
MKHRNGDDIQDTMFNGRNRKRLRPLPPISVVPTLLTLCNLLCGFAAIHYAAKPMDGNNFMALSSLTIAGSLIFLGLFFDAIDGSVARLTRSTSDLGAQLDSISDMVTFGVAPAYMMLRLVSHYYGENGTLILGPEADSAYAKVIWGVAAVYVCCTALRLARFNVETPSASTEDHSMFAGLPSPGAAGAIASLIVLHQHGLSAWLGADDSMTFARISALGIPLITLLCALAMNSRLPYVHIAIRYLSGNRDISYLIRIVVPCALAIFWFQEVLAIGFTAYALSGPWHWLRSRMKGTDQSDPSIDMVSTHHQQASENVHEHP